MKPVNNMVGNNIPINESSIAVCCEAVLVDISNPKESAVIMNKVLMAINSNTLPLIGTSSTNLLSNKITVRLTNESIK
ncbi:hypothetical protein D3C78_1610940 [compost metagenome]